MYKSVKRSKTKRVRIFFCKNSSVGMSDNEMEEEKYVAFRAVFGGEEAEQPSRGADGEKEMEAPPHDNEMEEEIYAAFRVVFGDEEAEQPSCAAEGDGGVCASGWRKWEIEEENDLSMGMW
ncbi:hypothetical protein AAC387_Pa01g3893 [Persea americana]